MALMLYPFDGLTVPVSLGSLLLGDYCLMKHFMVFLRLLVSLSVYHSLVGTFIEAEATQLDGGTAHVILGRGS